MISARSSKFLAIYSVIALTTSLAISLGVSVVSALHLPVAGKARLGHLRQDRVVFAWHTRDGLLQHGQVHVALSLVTVLGLLLVTVLVLVLVTVLGLVLVTILGLLLVTILGLGLGLVTVLRLTAAVTVGWLLVLRGEGVAKVGVVALRSNSMVKCKTSLQRSKSMVKF